MKKSHEGWLGEVLTGSVISLSIQKASFIIGGVRTAQLGRCTETSTAVTAEKQPSMENSVISPACWNS